MFQHRRTPVPAAQRYLAGCGSGCWSHQDPSRPSRACWQTASRKHRAELHSTPHNPCTPFYSTEGRLLQRLTTTIGHKQTNPQPAQGYVACQYTGHWLVDGMLIYLAVCGRCRPQQHQTTSSCTRQGTPCQLMHVKAFLQERRTSSPRPTDKTKHATVAACHTSEAVHQPFMVVTCGNHKRTKILSNCGNACTSSRCPSATPTTLHTQRYITCVESVALLTHVVETPTHICIGKGMQ